MAVADASAAGAVISNVKDYAKWVKCLLDKSAPFSSETHADIRKPRMLMSSDTDKNIMDVMTYGLGWMRNNIHGKTVFQHSGGMHAYGAEVFWLPEINYGIVAFGNTASSSNSAELDVVYRLIEDKLNIPAKDRIDIRAKSIKVRDGLPTQESATKDLFRDRPEEPLPGSFNTSQLVGRYKNEGWGDVKFTEEEDPKDASKTALIGPRDEASFRHTFILRHVTGDYWLVEAAMIGNSTYMKSYYRAQFVAGVDGEPAAMELDTAGEGDGIIVFTKFG
ncbi:hypothetical protein NLG97_g4810 [Lecanicillium saksenae]|uniref:Uncharacterized protein n=1 Tax=Lecanicillium saksenae TaxID=468837 RepID=A0ACC1QUT7_9HYPO|nr:hypothetical protein NLG97_g4810 [Lecanicillium saksenae]